MTPFASAHAALAKSGYHVLPIGPNTKAPSEFSKRWKAMSNWQRYRATPATELVRSLWASWPDGNIGILTGTPAGEGFVLACVDFDTDDFETLEALQSSLPISPVTKRGRRGHSAFYRVPVGTIGFRTPIAELLTDTRQTVLPPSVHPDTGQPYVWTSGTLLETPVESLPIITDLERFRDTVEGLTKTAISEPRAAIPVVETGEETWWRKLNNAAYRDLDAWVPELGLPKTRRDAGGYKAVASFRPSTTGRAIRDRKANLSIITNGGAKDFGTGKSYTAIELVINVHNLSLDDACRWLCERLGIVEQIDSPVTVTSNPTEALPPHDPETGEILTPVEAEAFPDHLTRVPGLLGEIVDWIEASARRPDRVLALGSALTLLGTLAGQAIAGPTGSATHLYVVGIAKSGAGKQHYKKCINNLLEAARLAHALQGPSGFKSDSAFVRFLQRMPRSICVIDEIGTMFSKMANKNSTHTEGISPLLREMWGLNFDVFLTPEWASVKSERIQWPALSVLGFTTEPELFKALTGSDISNGFLNRWTVFRTTTKPADRDPLISTDVPESLALRLNQFETWAHTLTDAERASPLSAPRAIKRMTWAGGQDPYKALMAKVEAIDDTSEEGSESFFARVGEMSLRIAAICALGMGRMEIDQSTMEWAIGVSWASCERLEAMSKDRMAENDMQRSYNMILRYIKTAGKSGLRHNQLLNKVKGRLASKQVKDICQQLTDAGQAIAEQQTISRPQGGGNAAIIYRAT